MYWFCGLSNHHPKTFAASVSEVVPRSRKWIMTHRASVSAPDVLRGAYLTNLRHLCDETTAGLSLFGPQVRRPTNSTTYTYYYMYIISSAINNNETPGPRACS